MGQSFRSHFPIFSNKTELVYLDSAATGQKLDVALKAAEKFYYQACANIHRGVYELAFEATDLYENARQQAQKFLSASSPEEIIFTAGTTASLNLLAHSLPKLFGKKRRVVLTRLEHHANLIPWQQAAKLHDLELVFVDLDDRFNLDYGKLEKLIDENTALVSFCHASNALGTLIDAKRVCELAKERGAYVIIDAAQTASHFRLDVQALGTDFLVFSGHKVYGPTGVGVLYGRREILNQLEPLYTGGEMVREVTYERATFADLPQRLEAGTPPIAQAIGLGAALEFLGAEDLQAETRALQDYAFEKLTALDRVTLYSAGPEQSIPVFSFTIDGIHVHDVCSLLDDKSICVRGGHHCTMPLMRYLGVAGTVRASLAPYNTKEDIDRLCNALQEIQKMF